MKLYAKFQKKADVEGLALAVQKKGLEHAAQQMPKEHNNPAAPTGYLLRVEHEFEAGKTAPLLLLGDLKTEWQKQAKEWKNENAKNILWGTCYAETQADGTICFRLLTKKGNAKLKDILKGCKSMLKQAGVGFDWAEGLSDESEETPDAKFKIPSGEEQEKGNGEKPEPKPAFDWTALRAEAEQLNKTMKANAKNSDPNQMQALKTAMEGFIQKTSTAPLNETDKNAQQINAFVQMLKQQLAPKAKPAETPEQAAAKQALQTLRAAMGYLFPAMFKVSK